MLRISEKNGNITLLRYVLFGFCDNVVLLCYAIDRRQRNIMLECYLNPVLTVAYLLWC